VSQERRTFVPKGWGWEDWIVNKDEYCGKVLFVKQGRKCSWHFHRKKDETFYVQAGSVLLRCLSEADYAKLKQNRFVALRSISDSANEWRILEHAREIILGPGHSFHIPVGMRHQFEGVLDSTIIEFSTKHEDSDSYRVIPGD
jgi:mannose-6-phosphate isomerase-like protein (cupin superfamily)